MNTSVASSSLIADLRVRFPYRCFRFTAFDEASLMEKRGIGQLQSEQRRKIPSLLENCGPHLHFYQILFQDTPQFKAGDQVGRREIKSTLCLVGLSAGIRRLSKCDFKDDRVACVLERRIFLDHKQNSSRSLWSFSSQTCPLQFQSGHKLVFVGSRKKGIVGSVSCSLDASVCWLQAR